MMNRRHFIRITASATAAASLMSFPFIVRGAGKQVVIIGGGAGGATAARYIRELDASIEVTLIEPKEHYHTCFMSNEVLSGERSLESIQFNYQGLTKHGIKVIPSRATAIDPEAKKVTLENGDSVSYERLIISPGIDFKWDAIEGYDQKVSEKIPHAWQAGPQTQTLRQQLEAMKDGGSVIIAPPSDPFRCPPGPYERASQIAMYLKQHKPKSKILILDAKEAFSKQGLFTQGWKKLYGYGSDNSMIEWLPPSKQGKVMRVDANSMTVYAGEFEDAHKADVINIIPPQTAGKIALDSGLADDSGWCPVDKKTFESTLHKNIHVLGDASIATKMPKSAYAANSQAKVCAAAIVAALQGKEMGTPSYVNTCYSVVGPDYGISVAAVYQLQEDTITPVEGAGGLTPSDASAETLKREVAYAHSWFKNITHEMFG